MAEIYELVLQSNHGEDLLVPPNLSMISEVDGPQACFAEHPVVMAAVATIEILAIHDVGTPPLAEKL
jgi:hypothetical protein